MNKTSKNQTTLQQRLHAIALYITTIFAERDELAEALLAAICTGYPLAIVSKPGTAKTAVVDALFKCIDGRAFNWLMTRYTSPDELAGPIDLLALQQGTMKRATAGTIIGADMVFLDEGFKANSATLNAQLSMLNEHQFEGHSCPWLLWIAASNEYPDGIGDNAQHAGDSLAALWDRYVLRLDVEYIKDDANLMRICFDTAEATPPAPLTRDEVMKMRQQVQQVTVPVEVQVAYLNLIKAVKANCQVSDRKAVKGVALIKAAAWLAGRTQATTSDLKWLRWSLWDEPSKRELVLDAVQDAMPQHMRMAQAAFTEAITEVGRVLSRGTRRDGVSNAELGKASDKVDAAINYLRELHAECDLDSMAAVAKMVTELQQRQRVLLTAITQTTLGDF